MTNDLNLDGTSRRRMTRPLWLGLTVGLIFLGFGLAILLGPNLHSILVDVPNSPHARMTIDDHFHEMGLITYAVAMILIVSSISILFPVASEFAAWSGGTIELRGSKVPVEVGGAAFLFFALFAIVGVFSWAYEPWKRDVVSASRNYADMQERLESALEERDTMTATIAAQRNVVNSQNETIEVYQEFFNYFANQNIGLLRVAVDCPGREGRRYWIDWTERTGANRVDGVLKASASGNTRLPITTRGPRYHILGDFDGQVLDIFEAELALQNNFLTLSIRPNAPQSGETLSLSRFCADRREESRVNQGIGGQQQTLPPTLEQSDLPRSSALEPAENESIADQ